MRGQLEELQDIIRPVTELLGGLSMQLLTVSPLAEVSRLAVLVNFYTGPLYKELQEQYGISRIEFVVLHCLLCASEKGLLAQDIVRATGYPKNSISRSISGLIANGHLERYTTLDDGRAKVLKITEKGHELIARIFPIVLKRQEKVFSALSPQERAILDKLTSKMIAKLPKWVGLDEFDN